MTSKYLGNAGLIFSLFNVMTPLTDKISLVATTLLLISFHYDLGSGL